MARPRKTMTIHREILRHVFSLGLSCNKTHMVLGISRGKVQDCVGRAQATDLHWEQIEALSDDDLEQLLFPKRHVEKPNSGQPDWEKILAELQRRGVKLRLLY